MYVWGDSWNILHRKCLSLLKESEFDTKKFKQGNGWCGALGSNHFAFYLVLLSCYSTFCVYIYIKLGFLQFSIRITPPS